MPERSLPFKVLTRQSGLGSLGRQRFTALAHWRGGTIAREAKALTPSAWLWARGRPAQEAPLHYTELLAQAIRCPDPTLKCEDGWLTRRLAPDGSRVELADLPGKRDDEKMFSAMGREVGNMHRQADKAEAEANVLRLIASYGYADSETFLPAAGFETDTWAETAGGEYKVNEHFTIGAAFTYVQSNNALCPAVF